MAITHYQQGGKVGAQRTGCIEPSDFARQAKAGMSVTIHHGARDGIPEDEIELTVRETGSSAVEFTSGHVMTSSSGGGWEIGLLPVLEVFVH